MRGNEDSFVSTNDGYWQNEKIKSLGETTRRSTQICFIILKYLFCINGVDAYFKHN
jgi:hypothetical protein